MSYPEHEKLRAIKDKSQAIGDFLDWLGAEKGVELAYRHVHTDGCKDDTAVFACGSRSGDLLPLNVRINSLLAEYFEIDEKKLEDEKQQMLEDIRAVK